MTFPYMLGTKSLTVVIDGQPYHLTRPLEGGDQGLWDQVVAALADENTTKEQLISLLKPEEVVREAVANVPEVVVINGQLFYNGAPVHNALSQKIVDIISEGLPVEPWVKFAQNVYANPAEFSREELYLFLEKANLPITEDGHFLAYKNVRADYKDIHSGTFDNSIGSVCEMERDKVDPVRDRTCSYGLHFASKEYLPHFYSYGSKTVVVKINPKDVVSIPSDYDNAKGRTCRYEVVGEIPHEVAQIYSWPAVIDEEEYMDDDNWWEEDPVDDDFYELSEFTEEELSEWQWGDDEDDSSHTAPVYPLVNENKSTKRSKWKWFKKG